jgi:hypothetical protein
MTMLCGINNIPRNIPHIHTKREDIQKHFVDCCRSVPENIVVDLNNVMEPIQRPKMYVESKLSTNIGSHAQVLINKVKSSNAQQPEHGVGNTWVCLL